MNTADTVVDGEFTTQAPEVEALPAVTSGEGLDVADLADDAIALHIASLLEEKSRVIGLINHALETAKNEMKRRMIERDQKKFAHAAFKKFELSAEYTEYIDDVDAAVKARMMLTDMGKEDEAAKLCRYVQEETKVIPAHWELGNRNSIKAIQNAYGKDVKLGPILAKVMSRIKVGDKLEVQLNS